MTDNTGARLADYLSAIIAQDKVVSDLDVDQVKQVINSVAIKAGIKAQNGDPDGKLHGLRGNASDEEFIATAIKPEIRRGFREALAAEAAALNKKLEFPQFDAKAYPVQLATKDSESRLHEFVGKAVGAMKPGLAEDDKAEVVNNVVFSLERMSINPESKPIYKQLSPEASEADFTKAVNSPEVRTATEFLIKETTKRYEKKELKGKSASVDENVRKQVAELDLKELQQASVNNAVAANSGKPKGGELAV